MDPVKPSTILKVASNTKKFEFGDVQGDQFKNKERAELSDTI